LKVGGKRKDGKKVSAVWEKATILLSRRREGKRKGRGRKGKGTARFVNFGGERRKFKSRRIRGCALLFQEKERRGGEGEGVLHRTFPQKNRPNAGANDLKKKRKPPLFPYHWGEERKKRGRRGDRDTSLHGKEGEEIGTPQLRL